MVNAFCADLCDTTSEEDIIIMNVSVGNTTTAKCWTNLENVTHVGNLTSADTLSVI
jgi:hypothetical protein